MSNTGKDIIQGLEEALAHARGKRVPVISRNVEVKAIDVKRIRRSLDLTQEQMAELLGTSVSGYRKWEQGARQPRGAAKTLLKVMEREPKALLRALA
jgi:putative transcriptional regulator